MLNLVKFECGCIGTSPDDSGISVLVWICDGGRDGPALTFFERNMSGKAFKLVPVEKTREFVRAICGKMELSERYLDIRNILERCLPTYHVFVDGDAS